MIKIDWSKQHCGAHLAPYAELLDLMPDLYEVLQYFPDDHYSFTWDVKVHMLMPGQSGCIPGWHRDFIPRESGVQVQSKMRVDLPIYMWISGSPLTQFLNGYLKPESWFKFTQNDLHRGIPASDFCWRGFIRATHREIIAPKESDWLRRHAQVYVFNENYQW